LRFSQSRGRAFEKDFARLSHRQPTRVANKELRAKSVFESTNLLAKCGLADVQALCSTSEAEIGRNLDKVTELP